MTSTDPKHTDPGAAFPATAWSVIRGAQDTPGDSTSRALGRLISVYWRPVYWTLRRDWNAGPEDARDLTQEYFARFLETEMVDSVREDLGRFRSYVKATLKHFMLHQRRHDAAWKRGGDHRIVALEDLSQVESDPADRTASPSQQFERELMQSILQQALADLERSSAKRNRSEAFALFHTYYLDQAGPRSLTYAALGAQFGLGNHEIKNTLADLRSRYRSIVLGYLRDGVSSEEEMTAELREVFQS